MIIEADYQKIQEEKKSKTAIESEISIEKKPKGSSFLRLIRYSWKHKLLLFVGNFGLLVTSLSMVALPYLTG